MRYSVVNMLIITQNIRIAAAYHAARTDTATAKLLCMPAQTYRDRVKNPGLWRLDELQDAAERLGVSVAWLLTPHTLKI